MSQQLTVSGLYNNRLVERFITLISHTTSLSRNASVTAVSIAAITTALLAWQKMRSSTENPAFDGIPTPKGARPIIGHILSLGSDLPGTFHTWHKELGPVFRIKLGSKDFIVISIPALTQDLLSTNGKYTSNRPDSFALIGFKHSGNNDGLVAGSPNDKIYNTLRKTVLNALGPKRLKEENSVLCNEANEFVDLVSTGKNIDPLAPLMRVSLNFILLTLFSTRTTSIDDPIYKQAIHIITTFMSFTGIVNTAITLIPLLRVLNPFFANDKKIAAFSIDTCKPFYDSLIEKALDVDGDNMVKLLNEELNQGKRGNYDNMFLTINDMLVAGTDTTAVTITWAFLQLSTKPEVQKKIQEEIDAFVDKHGRMPYFWERDSVPYLIAVQRECFRLRPTTEFGVPHAAAEDFEWRGTLIPKQTWIVPNMMEAHMDPEKYPNPEKFDPDRFLGQEDTMFSSANRRPENRDHFNFGWGRRVCPGSHLAETQMFSVWVRVLAKCDIMPAVDKDGNDVPETLDTVAPKTGPTVVSPSPFKIRFVPRNKH
ncbi:cytochrome P450 [Circinella umbellata]|nr:cytochrome P450 [Circinella umbellata]